MVYAVVGLVLHATLFVVLTGICAFDDGRLVDWQDCLLPLGLLALPGILAAAGLSKRVDVLLLTAGTVALVLAFLSLTRPGLFLLLPAILYLIAGATVR